MDVEGVIRLNFVVAGEAIPQGSMRGFVNKNTGQAIVTSANKRTRAWRDRVADEAREHLEGFGHGMLTGAVGIRVVFTMVRPAGHFGKRGLLPSARRRPTVKPDIDKLLRAILDALTGVAYRDDAQVVRVDALQFYIDDPTVGPTTTITITDYDGGWES